jgi:diguanylate cyclase (GGDEF)-like protein
MNYDYERMSTKYNQLMEAAQSFFRTLQEIISANTFFVAENDSESNLILSAWNKDENFGRQDSEIPFDITYSKIVSGQGGPVVIADTSTSELTKNLAITADLGACSFVGVPIYLRDGRFYGSVCALDRQRVFSQEDAKLLERMADFICRLVELEEGIVYDDLTGVYRRGYVEVLYNHFSTDSEKAVAFLDLDNFKRINDTYGHEAGDRILHRVGTLLKATADQYDALACRYAGDEFLLIFQTGQEDEVIAAVENFLQKLSDPIEAGGFSIPLTASVGICLEASTLQQYIQRADTAMCQTKQGNQQGIRIFAAG